MPKRNNSTTSAGAWKAGFNSLLGWGITTLLLQLFNRNKGGDTSSPQPSKYTSDNTNSIGSPIPVAIGRVMIKNPLVSYYGDFGSEPYTEEYGMHSKLDAKSLLWPLLLGIITMLLTPSHHMVKVVTSAGAGTGLAVDVANGAKMNVMVTTIISVLINLLMWLFNRHAGRTTIQKGFKYYLGWQHIICWTGDNIGIKKLWMNVYDSNVESSTEQGVWDNSTKVAWKKDNPNGIVAHIDQPDMFGGVDEGGGFVGDVRMYLGTNSQPFDSWMVKEMNQDTIEQDLRGLTPRYPFYVTAVIPRAYIGKQATIPEMWFEVLNYPQRLSDNHQDIIDNYWEQRITDGIAKVEDYISRQDKTVQEHVEKELEKLKEKRDEKSLNALIEKYPPTNRDELKNFSSLLTGLYKHGKWKLGKLEEDENPADVLYEILKNENWGAKYSDDKIDIESLVALGAICEEERLGISCLINSISTVGDYIEKILDHINGVVYVSAKTGKLTFRLIRANYDVATLPVFDVNNCSSMEFTRLDWSETMSAVSVDFTGAGDVEKYDKSTMSIFDESNVHITENYTETSIDGSYFTTPKNAKWMGENKLLSLGYPLSSVEITCNRLGHNLAIGDVVIVTWQPYGIEKQVYRISDIDYGTLTDGKIKITALEDVFGFDSLKYDYSNIPDWTDTGHPPKEIGRYQYVELPFEYSRDLNTFIHVFAAQPSNFCIGWHVWRRVAGTYKKSATSTKYSMIGRVMYGILERYDHLAEGFELKGLGNNAEEDFADYIKERNSDPYMYNNKSGLNMVLVDDEIMSFDKITLLPNGNYNLSGVIRGCFDTIPGVHTAESTVIFFGTGISITGTQMVARAGEIATESLELTTYTVTDSMEFDYAKTEGFVTRRRSESPSIMADLKFTIDRGELTKYEYQFPAEKTFSGNVLFKFKGRNKFTDYNIYEHTSDTDILNAETTQNVLRVKCGEVEFDIKEDALYTDDDGVKHNVNKMELDWSRYCREMGDKLKQRNTTVLEIQTFDKQKNLYSYNKYEKQIIYAVPRVIGYVESEDDIEAYLNEVCRDTIVTKGNITMTYDECPLVIVAEKNGITTGQDNETTWKPSNKIYKVDGKGKYHKMNVEDGFTYRSNFGYGSQLHYYKYESNTWGETSL